MFAVVLVRGTTNHHSTHIPARVGEQYGDTTTHDHVSVSAARNTLGAPLNRHVALHLRHSAMIYDIRDFVFS